MGEGKPLKSAFELAIERLAAKGGAGAAERVLTEAQKTEIAAVRAEYKARRAEVEMLRRTALDQARAADDPEKYKRLEADYQEDLARLTAEEEGKVLKIKG